MSQDLYLFASFRMEIRNRTVTRHGQDVGLTPKEFETLRILVEHGGRLVPKATLMESLWPGAFFDENNLAQHIKSLRRKLGDGPEGSSLIKTRVRQGYWLAAPVTGISTEEPSHARTDPDDIAREPEILAQVGTQPTEGMAGPSGVPSSIERSQRIEILPPSRRNKRRWLVFTLVGSTIAAAGLLVGIGIAHRTNDRRPRVLKYTQLTNDGLPKVGLMVDDGKRVYFNEETLDGLRLVSVPAAGGEIAPVQLSGLGQMVMIEAVSIDLKSAIVRSR